MNDSTVKAIRKLKNGNGDYLWQPSVTVGPPDMLLGRPVYTSAYMPAIAASAKKSSLFGDLGYYWVADREGRSFKRLNELYAATGRWASSPPSAWTASWFWLRAVKVLHMKARKRGGERMNNTNITRNYHAHGGSEWVIGGSSPSCPARRSRARRGCSTFPSSTRRSPSLPLHRRKRSDDRRRPEG